MLLPAGTAAAAAPGALDPRFAGGGVAPVRGESVNDLVVQPNARIVLAGTRSLGGRSAFALERRRRDGRPDPSFGAGGRLITRFGDGRCVAANAVVVAADGRMVAAGRSGCTGGRFALARYLPDGRLDRAFSSDGRVTTRFGRRCAFSKAQAVAVQANGRIVAAGQSACRRSGRLRVTFAVARYLPSGRLDPSFSGDGRVTTDFTPVFDGAMDVLIEPGGGVVAAGIARIEDFERSRFALARYTRRGRLDRSFGGDGRVTALFGGDQDCGPAEAHALARQADGKLVTAGVTGCGHPSFALARFQRDGGLDLSFGGDGKVATLFRPGDCSELAKDVAVQPDGRIVAVGVAGCANPHPEFALARYLPGGALDRSFGGDGLVTTHLRRAADCFDQLNAVGLQHAAGIVAAGTTSCRGTSGSALLRYLG